jgi:hypothetical protein
VDYSIIPFPISKESRSGRTSADSRFCVPSENLVVFVEG